MADQIRCACSPCMQQTYIDMQHSSGSSRRLDGCLNTPEVFVGMSNSLGAYRLTNTSLDMLFIWIFITTRPAAGLVTGFVA